MYMLLIVIIAFGAIAAAENTYAIRRSLESKDEATDEKADSAEQVNGVCKCCGYYRYGISSYYNICDKCSEEGHHE